MAAFNKALIVTHLFGQVTVDFERVIDWPTSAALGIPKMQFLARHFYVCDITESTVGYLDQNEVPF